MWPRCSETLTSGRWMWSTATLGGVWSRWSTGADVELQRWQHVLELGFEADVPGCPDGAGGHRLGKVAGHGLVGLVLQETGEEEVAGLEEFEVEHFLPLFVREESGDLEIEQGRGDEEELGDLGKIRPILELGGVGDELVGDLGQGDLRDVEATLRDQPEQQVEGAGEVLQLDLEALRRGLGRLARVRGLTDGTVAVGLPVDTEDSLAQGAPPREMSSLASLR